MQESISKTEPEDDPAVRREMFLLAAFAAIVITGLLAAIVASFLDLLPNWVWRPAGVALALTAWFVSSRSESVRYRLPSSTKK